MRFWNGNAGNFFRLVDGAGVGFAVVGFDFFDAGVAVPVAVHQCTERKRRQFAQGVGGGNCTVQRLPVQADDFCHVLKLRREAEDADAEGGDVGVVREQALAAVRHGLDAVDGEEGGFFAGVHAHAVRVFEAAELAVVFVEVVVARGEAARGVGERDFAPGKEFGFAGVGAGGEQGGEFVAAEFGGRLPAVGAEAADKGKGVFVVEVEATACDEGVAVVARQFDRAHVVGFDGIALLFGDFAQAFEVALAFEQGLAGEQDFFAGCGEVVGNGEPVGEAQFVAARADGFAEVDDVGVGVGDAVVPGEDGLFRPVVLDGSEGEFEAHDVSLLFVYIHFERSGVCINGGNGVSSLAIRLRGMRTFPTGRGAFFYFHGLL